MVIDNDKPQIKLAKSNSAKVVVPKATGNKRKMDDKCPTFILKTTSEKFKMLDSNNTTSHESVDDVTAATDSLTNDDYPDSYDECSSYHDITDHDNTETIKSKRTILKKKREDMLEINVFPNLFKDRFLDPAAEDYQELFKEAQKGLDLKHNLGQVIEILEHKMIYSCPSVLVRSNSGEEDWIKVINMKHNLPIYTARWIVKHCDVSPSNSRMISWAQARTKKTKITLRRGARIIRSMKSRQ